MIPTQTLDVPPPAFCSLANTIRQTVRQFFLCLLFVLPLSLHAADLRRPISPQQPMWLIHIDTWNYPDPQEIIDLVPADIRPYVVMNISLSISHNTTTNTFQVAEYGYEIAKSWLRACAENRMWAMVQCSSGGFSQFSDFDLSVYEEFYRDYPNFIGFNYAEQFWGYDDPNDPLSARWVDRMAHFANLLKLSNNYGGYLVVSMCWNQWGPSINPIGQMKRSPAFAAACRDYTENYILCEKYTTQSYQSDMESVCLGSWLSGYAGQYGMRYDDTGWTDSTGTHANFTMATQGAPFLEHAMLTGQTVMDGPELIWTQCFRETNRIATTNGYTARNWETFPQFGNVSVDLFRKVIDGTVRIPTRREVIDRTKVVIVNNVNSGSNDDIYSSPTTLFEGLYRMDGDGNLANNKSFFKKTGRYPTIPTVYQLDDADANSFQVKVNRSAYATRWPSIASKQTEFNSLFPSEYTGNLYAGRHQNGWVVYNPYKTGQMASGSIPFKYNTCDRMELTFSQYTAGVVKEVSNKVTFYLSNYDNVLNTGLKTDTIRIHGASSEPTYTWADRGNHQASVVTKSWSGGVFTLTVQHNGPLDLTVSCSGGASGRLTQYTTALVHAPAEPMVYEGRRQYEAESFDYKSITGIVTSGYSGTIRNYTGQGYLQFGASASAAVRDTVTVPRSGTYVLETRYSVTGSSVNTADLYVNGTLAASPVFNATATSSDWAIQKQTLTLNEGSNILEFRARASGAASLCFDNIAVAPTSFGDGLVIQEGDAGFGGVDGFIETTYAGFTGAGYANTDNYTGASIDWSLDFETASIATFTFRHASTSDRTADLYVNGVKVASGIVFRSTGAWDAWDFVTVCVGLEAGSADVRLEATSGAGLPNIDAMETNTMAASLTASMYQAESVSFGNGTATETLYGGYNGSGYLNFPGSGGFLQIDGVSGGAGGEVSLNIRYALGAAARSGLLIVNGVPQTITFPTTGSWTTWGNLGLTVTLNGGTNNTIRIESNGADLANLDQLEVSRPLQAESATYDSGTVLESLYSGYKGTGYLNFPGSGGSVELAGVDGGTGGTATIKIRYALGSANRTGVLLVNGVSQPITFAGTGSWSTWATHSVSVNLDAGTNNTVRIESNGGDLGNLDQFELSRPN